MGGTNLMGRPWSNAQNHPISRTYSYYQPTVAFFSFCTMPHHAPKPSYTLKPKVPLHQRALHREGN